MAFVENTAPLFADFGVDITLNGIATRGIFDNAFGAAFGGLIDGSGPMVRLPSSIAVSRGNPVIINATNYVVTGIEPDGTGITTLRLDEA